MELTEVQERSEPLLTQLLAVWERSVRATHTFLTAEEIARIREYVPSALAQVLVLVVLTDHGVPVAFMGIAGDKLEMLFVAPESRGQGLGRRLIRYGIDHYALREVSVNEQNPQAVGFYAHMGFQTYRRTERDEQGGPYPLLYMRRGRTSGQANL